MPTAARVALPLAAGVLIAACGSDAPTTTSSAAAAVRSSTGSGSDSASVTSGGVTTPPPTEAPPPQATPAPTAVPTPITQTALVAVLFTVHDLPAGWTAVGGPPSYQPGQPAGGGCMPDPQLANVTSTAGEDFSYHLNAQGVEAGHIAESVAAFTSPDGVSSYMAVVAAPGYGPCIANSKAKELVQAGGSVTSNPTVKAVPMPPNVSGTHFHVSFSYTFARTPKTAEDDVYYLASGRMRARIDFDTCCTPFDPTMLDTLVRAASLQMGIAQA